MAVFFPSVVSIKNETMVNMFKLLDASGLKTFLGYIYSISEPILAEFFNTVSIDHDAISCIVQGQKLNISQRIFAEVFYLLGVRVTFCKDIPPANDET